MNPAGIQKLRALKRTFELYDLSASNALVHCQSHATASHLTRASDLLALVFRHILEAPAEPFLSRIRIREMISHPLLASSPEPCPALTKGPMYGL